MRLRIVQVLQPVLEAAQEHVALGELARGLLRQRAALGEPRERFQRRPDREHRLAPAAHQLHRLHDELDLADSARPELDVLRQLAPRHVAPHFGVQPAHRGERAEVEVLAVDERPHDRIELRVAAAGDRPRLDPRVALPFAPLRDEIGFQRLEARDQRPGFAVGPQPHVDAEHEAVLGDIA